MRRLLVTAGMVGVFVLGAGFWLALGVMFFTWKDAQSSLPSVFPTPLALNTATLAPTLVLAAVPATPTPAPTATPRATPTPIAILATNPVPTPSGPTAAADADARAPWVLLPQPAAGARVPAGSVTLEARARGDAPIVSIRLEIDGAPVQTALDQRSDVIWRGWATTTVKPGQHTVRATVTDSQGRQGGYRWTFTAG